MALDLLRRSAYCKRKRRWVRAHHGGARRREHVRGRGAAIVGTSGDLPSAASEKGPERVPKPRGNSAFFGGTSKICKGQSHTFIHRSALARKPSRVRGAGDPGPGLGERTRGCASCTASRPLPPSAYVGLADRSVRPRALFVP